MPQPSVDQPEVPATQGSHLPRPSKTKAMENAAWRTLKPKTYPKKKAKSAATDAPTTNVSMPPPKKKRRSNTDTLSTAADSEFPAEEPNNNEMIEVPRRRAPSHNSSKVPPHLEHHQKALAHSSEDEFDPEDKPQDDKSQDGNSVEDEDNEDLIGLNNEALRQTFDDEAVSWDDNQSPKSSQHRQLAHRNYKAGDHGNVDRDNGRPFEPSQYRQPAYRSYRDDDASDYGDLNVDDFDVDNGATKYGGVNINGAHGIDNNIDNIDNIDNNGNNNLGGPQAHARAHKEPLSKRAAERRAELLVLSDDNHGTSVVSTTALRERNARWPHAPICVTL
ncbi:hypothetical protein H4582DRAFT_2056383 [Lactarius indigo]|nr:hypothetical protein H4582DRAFT_2056383 [Lactarius indigo]